MRSVALVAALAQVAFALPAAAEPDIPGGLTWGGNNPTIRYSNNVDRTWDGFLRRGAGDWSRSRVLNTNVVGGSANNAGSLCDPRATRFTRGEVEVCDGRYGGTGWLGLTDIYYYESTKRIVGARVFMNDSYFDGGRFDDPDAKRHTMTHELGHALGLSHATGRSVMNDSATAIFAYDQPTAADYDRLERLYGSGNRSAITADADADQSPETEGISRIVIVTRAGE